jgi:hypothetical protein
MQVQQHPSARFVSLVLLGLVAALLGFWPSGARARVADRFAAAPRVVAMQGATVDGAETGGTKDCEHDHWCEYCQSHASAAPPGCSKVDLLPPPGTAPAAATPPSKDCGYDSWCAYCQRHADASPPDCPKPKED